MNNCKDRKVLSFVFECFGDWYLYFTLLVESKETIYQKWIRESLLSISGSINGQETLI